MRLGHVKLVTLTLTF